MTSLLIIVAFFALSATIGMVFAALAPGGFMRNVGEALAVCIGAPAAIGVFGVILGLGASLFKFMFG